MTDHPQMAAPVRAYVTAFENGEAEAVGAIFADDAVNEDLIGAESLVDQIAIREF